MSRMRKLKTIAFVDAANIIYGAKAEGWFIDLRKLYGYLKEKYGISKALFYYGKDSRSTKEEKFIKRLQDFGYTLKVKEIKRYGEKTKANCDVDLTMDVLLTMKEYRRAIVLSGDGDFAPLLTYILSKGKKVIVIASPKRTAKEIRKIIGGEFIDFGSLRYFLEYKKRGRP